MLVIGLFYFEKFAATLSSTEPKNTKNSCFRSKYKYFSNYLCSGVEFMLAKWAVQQLVATGVAARNLKIKKTIAF